MVKIDVIIKHREKPSAVHLDKYGLKTLNKNGQVVLTIEKSDLNALKKQGKRDTKFTVTEVKTNDKPEDKKATEDEKEE
jgi:hypothetical protein